MPISNLAGEIYPAVFEIYPTRSTEIHQICHNIANFEDNFLFKHSNKTLSLR